jgi:hypothetical protein
MWQERWQRSTVLYSLGSFAVGGLLGALPVGIYLYGHGLRELLEIWRVYGTSAYVGARGLAQGSGPLAILDVVMAYVREWQLLVWLTLAGCVVLLLHAPRKKSAGVILAFLLSSLAAVALQNKWFEYHWIPALAPVAILSSVSIAGLVREFRAQMRGVAPGEGSKRSWHQLDVRSVFAGVVIAGLVLWMGYDGLARYRRLASYLGGHMGPDEYYAQFDIGRDFSHMGSLRAAAYLQEQTAPDETALIWGAEPLVHFLANRRSPTKYIFAYMLAGEAGDALLAERRQDFVEEAQRAVPSYILLVENDANPLLPLGSRALLDEVPAFRAWLESEYTFETQVDDYLFYRRG